MDRHEAKAFAPATIANLGPGFDVLGLALDAPGDMVTARRIPEREIRVASILGDGGSLSREMRKNTAGMAAYALWRAAAPEFGIELVIEKGMALGSGMGSSAASAVAAAVAVNALLGGGADDAALLRAAAEGERVAAGASIHYDNIAASLLGGLVRVRDAAAVHVERILPLPQWHLAVVHPSLTVRTSEARAAVPFAVRESAVATLASRVDALVSAITGGDIVRAGEAIMSDDVITPYRSALIAGYDRVIAAALDAGAAGAGISGSGPSLFALTENEEAARHAGQLMTEAWRAMDIQAEIHVSRFDAPGARLVP